MKINIQQIPLSEALPWILKKHYAHRKCPVSFAFGAFRDNKLIGIVTYGTPFSPTLRIGICGEKYADIILELNRLCCVNEKNIASRLIGQSLRLLSKPSIVVSYADTKMHHIGYVYQATNFYYTGLSAKRTDWKVKGQENKHGGTIADQSRGKENRAQWMREKYGDDFYLEDRPRKHRYVYFCAKNIKQKAEMFNALRYEVIPYPKGESTHYKCDCEIISQGVLSI